MKKFSLISFIVLTCGSLMALPVRNPVMPRLLYEGTFCEGSCPGSLWDFWFDPCYDFCDSLAIRFGYSGDFVFDRHMKLERDGGADMRRVSLTRNSGLIALNFFNQFDVFGTLGGGRVSIETSSTSFGSPSGESCCLITNSHFCWSLGGCGTIYEWGCFSIGAEIEYFYNRPEIKKLIAADTFSNYLDQTLILKYQEWQVGVAFSYQMHFIVPYIGVKWANAWITMDEAMEVVNPRFDPFTLRDLESKKRVGYAVGASLFACDAASATIEGRFGDEKALYANVQFQF